jgi:hypothetical protein
MSADPPAPTPTDARTGDSGADGRPATTGDRAGSVGRCRGDPGTRASGVADGRAVSYALGFVVVFSVVLAGTLALFVTGVDLLSDVDRDGAVAAGEANVDVIHSELGDMVTQGDKRRGFHLELVDTQVRVTNSEAVRLRIESDDPTLSGITYGTRALRYEVPPHDTTFVYALGHVYRVDNRGDGSARSEQPPVFEVSDRQTRLVVPVLTGSTADSPDEVGVTGTGERAFVALQTGSRASLTRTGTAGDNASGSSVDSISGTLTVEAVTHPSVWVTALETTGFDDIQVGPEGATVTGAFESDRLTVRRADIALALGGEAAQ